MLDAPCVFFMMMVFPGGAAANTLEEIMEQEETNASVMSATASDTQGEDCSLNMSADVSLHSPSPDTDLLASVSMERNGEDQSRDLSSDGKYELQYYFSTLSHVLTSVLAMPLIPSLCLTFTVTCRAQ